MLSASGRLMGDLTTMRLADDQFLIGGSGYLQTWHMRWFGEHLLQSGVTVRNTTDEYAGIAIFGPRSRELLARVAKSDVSNAALPFMSVRQTDLGFAPAILARLSVSGELGFEIYVPSAYLYGVLEALSNASDGLGARHVGLYALNSLRLEKSFGIWSREFSRDYTPHMAGLERFIAYERPDFIGREAALRDRDSTPGHRLVTLAIESEQADPTGYEPILLGKEMVGFVTSGGYGHTAQQSLAMGYLHSNVPDRQNGLTVPILGDACAAKVLANAAIDPAGTRMRG
jgi:dimethylglycine dehydrogenase